MRMFLRFTPIFMAALLASAVPAVSALMRGELVRLTRSETLKYEGKNFLGAPKGQEFTLLKNDPLMGTAHVAFVKEDGSAIAVSLPADALEASPPTPWTDLLRGTEAFRDGRPEEAKRLLARAAQDPQLRAIAGPLSTRVVGVLGTPRATYGVAMQGLRDSAEQLSKLGHASLALAIDDSAERLGKAALGAGAPASKVQREELLKRVATANRALARCRQAVALRRMNEASRYIAEGLQAEPARADFIALQTTVKKALADAESDYEAANRMRRFEKGAVHALTALEQGLKSCADHPHLLALKLEMQALFEERTAPPITPAFLAAAGAEASKTSLEEGRKLYTTRCTECHDLELLDSRSISGWRDMVGSMSRRAGIDGGQQSKIVEYLTAAQRGL
jgi:hypothetical protein